jgi:hypothetical protein
LSPHLKRVRAKAEALIRDFSPQQWENAHPGKWSASQILEHLILTYSATTKGAQKSMQLTEPFCRELTLRDRVGQFYVVTLGIFPSGRKASKQTWPTHKALDDPLRRFNDALVAMDATLMDAERRFGTKTRILDHPILGPLTAEQWRRFHRVHSFHHLSQIAALRDGTYSYHASA